MKRSELHAAIWARPVSEVASELGVSDTWLRKVCVANGVPLPPQGYRQRLQAGHHIQAPPAPHGEDREVRIRRLSRSTAFRALDRPSKSAPAAAVSAAVAATPEGAATKNRKPRSPSIDLELEMALLERDADRVLRHRAMQDLLADLAAKLAVAPELDPLDWRGWLLDMRAKLQQHSPQCDIEAWAMRRFGADKHRSS